jgi:glutamate-ammonia-ligase adenylyltransferase
VSFGIVGMGKLGGHELGYGSDLDLVFLHDSRGSGQETEGGSQGKSLDNARFFARLGQRIIHFVTTLTAEGALYSIDMRLRPGGKSGQLAASLDRFREYEQESAWTWEHQALLRGRMVAGGTAVAEGFRRARRDVLMAERDAEALAQAIREMRARMLAEHGSSDSGTFHLKQDRGGLVDVDFLVQYLCLRYAHASPAILEPNTRAALRALAEHGHLAADDAERLEADYALYRTLENRIKLFEDRADPALTPDPTWREQLDRLVASEQRPVAERIESARTEVREAFDRIVGPPELPEGSSQLRRSSS